MTFYAGFISRFKNVYLEVKVFIAYAYLWYAYMRAFYTHIGEGNITQLKKKMETDFKTVNWH